MSLDLPTKQLHPRGSEAANHATSRCETESEVEAVHRDIQPGVVQEPTSEKVEKPTFFRGLGRARKKLDCGNADPRVPSIPRGIQRGLRRTKEEWEAKHLPEVKRNRSRGKGSDQNKDSRIRRGLRRTAEELQAKQISPHLVSSMSRDVYAVPPMRQQRGLRRTVEELAANQEHRQNAQALRCANETTCIVITEEDGDIDVESFTLDQQVRTECATELAEARAVENGDRNNLTRAVEVDPENLGRRSLQHRRQLYQQGGFGALLMTAFLFIIIVVVVETLKKTQIQPIGYNTTSIRPPETALSPEDYLLSLLPKLTVDAILLGERNIQEQSFQWLLEDPTFQNYSQGRLLQRFALSTLYLSTQSDSGWQNEDNWQSYEVHECHWYLYRTDAFYEIPESETNLLYNVTNATAPCNEEGLFEHLWLVQNNLQGSLPEELYLLTSLKSLSLDRNGLHGTLSSQIGLLSNLEALAMFNNIMTSSIPSEIGLLSHLEFLWVMRNEWTGSIPTEVGLLSSLVYLVGDSCHFSGPLPTELGRLTNLKWLWLWLNEFTGALPSEFGLMENLTSVAIDFNNFTGTIPTEVGMMTNMDTFHIEHNFLSGTLPSELVLLTNLNSFVCCSTFITGSIPSELGLLANLTKRLWAWDNLLTGIMPTELGMLSELGSLEFSDNHLRGTIPSELGNLRFAWMMRLQNNHLTGTLPTEVGLLQGMSTFWVNGNPLTGPIPSELGAMDSIFQYWDEDQNQTVEFSPLVDLQLDNFN